MGKLYIVATPIGNLGDMTFRAVLTLKTVKYILAEDTRHTLRLLNHFEIKVPLVSYHKFNERERASEIISGLALADYDIALVTDAGTPCISDPGSIIVDEALNSGVEVLPVPGASAVITALSVSGFDLTSFEFKGFFPREKKEQREFIKQIEDSKNEVCVFFESPKRILKALEALSALPADTQIFVANDLTKKFERKFRGTISSVLTSLSMDEKTALGEYVVALRKNMKHADEHPKSTAEVLSLESILVENLLKNGGTLKDAVKRLTNNPYPKNELYKASLNLKNLLS